MRSLDIADVLMVALGENNIDLLQTAVGSLRVEEPDEWQERCVHGREEQVGTPSNMLNHDRGDHNDSEVEQPVAASRDGVGLGTSLDRRDLGRVQPWQGQPSSTKKGHVKEQTKDSTLGTRRVSGDQASESNGHGRQLTECSSQEELATTDLLDEEPGERSEDGIDNHVDTTNQQRHVLGLMQRLLEQYGKIVDDRIATTELLEDLGRRTDQHTAEVLGSAVGQKVSERGLPHGTRAVRGRVSIGHSEELSLTGGTYALIESRTSDFCS